MENTSRPAPGSKRDLAYYRQRQKNRVFTELVRFFAEEAERRGITKKDLAKALGKDPAQITRWFSAPSNFELDTLSDILLALGAEMDHRIVRFEERSRPKSTHPLVASAPTLDRAVANIVDVMQPEAIYLYGSRARGDAREDSDYDFLVVVADDAPAEQRSLAATARVPRDPGVGLDIVPCRRTVFERNRHQAGTLSHLVTHEGRLVYGR